MSQYQVFIDGSHGTTGLRIYERLAEQGGVTLIPIEDGLRKDAAARAEAINSSDITFLCLPDDAAREAVKMTVNPNVRLIDASTAHRTETGWSYGFPELSQAHREAVEKGTRVAVPGCHASGFAALVYPLIAAGVIGKDYPLSCFSLTGYSGGGKGMIGQYEDQERDKGLDAPRHYALPQSHKHLKEMTHVSGLAFAPNFYPVADDFYSGMTVTVPLFPRLMEKRCSLEDVRGIYRELYFGSPVVTVLESGGGEDGFWAANALAGKDAMEIMVAGNDERISLMARFDNLGKGASGAALQCMNIMTGAPETAGLVL